jgi:hypothetical protein
MKILIFSLTLLLATFQVFGQRKSKVDPKDAQIDSLLKTSKSLSYQLDSVSVELVKYTGMYSVLKEKVIHYNFDPARTGFLIDSLKASRDSASLLLTPVIKQVPNDSLTQYLKENQVLKAKVDSIKTAWNNEKALYNAEDLSKAKAISSLKQLKELLADKIITETEFITLKKKYLDKL